MNLCAIHEIGFVALRQVTPLRAVQRYHRFNRCESTAERGLVLSQRDKSQLLLSALASKRRGTSSAKETLEIFFEFLGQRFRFHSTLFGHELINARDVGGMIQWLARFIL